MEVQKGSSQQELVLCCVIYLLFIIKYTASLYFVLIVARFSVIETAAGGEKGKFYLILIDLIRFLHKIDWSSSCGDVEILPLEANLGIT